MQSSITGQYPPADAQEWTEESQPDDLLKFALSSADNHNQALGEIVMETGGFSPQTRISMLGLCLEKSLKQAKDNFIEDLQRATEKFLGIRMERDFQIYEELCREVVRLVPEDKWMRFARLHLNLDEQELKNFKRQFATLNSEQMLQSQRF